VEPKIREIREFGSSKVKVKVNAKVTAIVHDWLGLFVNKIEDRDPR